VGSGIPRPLQQKRIIDLSQFIAGPTAAQYLADFGANVIKIEAPTGDPIRGLTGNKFGSFYIRSFNTGKQSEVIDLKSDKGRCRLDNFLETSDAFICNLGPDALVRLKLDGPTLRKRFPHLVITLISGYGQDDPRGCMDTIAQCEAGFAVLNADSGGGPRLSTSWPVDKFTGMFAGMSTAMALLDTPSGCLIDISMMEVAASMLLGPAALAVSEGEQLSPPTGNGDRASAPSTIFKCADGFVYIYAGLDAYWDRIRPYVNGEEAGIHQRIANADQFEAKVQTWVRNKTQHNILNLMKELGIPAGAVLTPAQAVESIRAMRPGAVTTPMASGEHIPTFPALFDGRRIPRTAAPFLGQGKRFVSND